jgi:hypothetical protein
MMKAWMPALFLTVIACGGGAPAPTAPTAANTTQTAPSSQPTEAAPDMSFKPLNGAMVSFVEPADGAEVTNPVKVVFQVEGATVKPAGELVEGTGHHHIIIDGTGAEAGTAVAKDDTHIHYGGGQTEAELTLSPGVHTLTLQFADGMHRSYGPGLSKTISVTVKE